MLGPLVEAVVAARSMSVVPAPPAFASPLLAPPATTARSSPRLMPRRVSDSSAATWLVYSKGSGLTEEWQERRRVWEGT